MDIERPNILWITTDQQRWDSLGCYGNENVATPSLDRLANEGVRFDRAYCQNPVCTPSRASFLTGRYPRTTGVRANGQPMPEDEQLVTNAFAEAGYHCGLAGKLHLSPTNPDEDTPRTTAEPPRRIDDGYAEFHLSQTGLDDQPGNEYAQWRHERGIDATPSPVEGSSVVSTRFAAADHQTTWCADRTITCIERFADREQPWLYSVNPFDPHSPFDPPREYLDPYLDQLDDIPLPNYEPGELDDKPVYQRLWQDKCHVGNTADLTNRENRLIRAAYYAMVDLIDDCVGRMLDALERTGQREETLIVFTSDHGELLGDHGMYLKGPFLYEPSVRVPLLVSQPGTVASEVQTDALVELVDLAPTLLDAAGLERQAGMQGRSLWPLLTGEREPSDHRDSVYAEFYESNPQFEGCDPMASMIRTDRYKLVRESTTDDGELYDLAADPAETDNLWNDPEYRETKATLLERLVDRMAATVDPLPAKAGDW